MNLWLIVICLSSIIIFVHILIMIHLIYYKNVVCHKKYRYKVYYILNSLEILLSIYIESGLGNEFFFVGNKVSDIII